MNEMSNFYMKKLPFMIENANKCEFLMNVYFEKEWAGICEKGTR